MFRTYCRIFSATALHLVPSPSDKCFVICEHMPTIWQALAENEINDFFYFLEQLINLRSSQKKKKNHDCNSSSTVKLLEENIQKRKTKSYHNIMASVLQDSTGRLVFPLQPPQLRENDDPLVEKINGGLLFASASCPFRVDLRPVFWPFAASFLVIKLFFILCSFTEENVFLANIKQKTQQKNIHERGREEEITNFRGVAAGEEERGNESEEENCGFGAHGCFWELTSWEFSSVTETTYI